MSFLCCDCCLNIFGSKKNKKQKKKSQQIDYGQQIDEEELMTKNINKHAKQLPVQYLDSSKQMVGHDINEMNVGLQLQNAEKAQEKDIVSKSETTSNNTESQKEHSQNQQEQVDQQVNQQKLKPNFAKFSINLDPYDKYYKLLHQKTQNLSKYFIVQGKNIDIGSTKSDLRISKLQNHKFSVKFQLPCSYSFYTMLMKDSNINNKKYMSNFQKSQILQAYKANFTKNVVKVKRYNMLQPRQFIYLKYSNGSFKQNWQICISQSEEDLLSQIQPSEHKRCDIFAVSNFKQINERLYVNEYIEIDLKANNMNVNIWGRIMSEVKDYFQKLYSHIQNYYQKQLL